jgi:hypothetical protein
MDRIRSGKAGTNGRGMSILSGRDRVGTRIRCAAAAARIGSRWA